MEICFKDPAAVVSLFILGIVPLGDDVDRIKGPFHPRVDVHIEGDEHALGRPVIKELHTRWIALMVEECDGKTDHRDRRLVQTSI
jgi:hypothetical protein